MSLVTICDEPSCQEVIYKEPIRVMYSTPPSSAIVVCNITERDFCSFKCLAAYAMEKE